MLTAKGLTSMDRWFCWAGLGVSLFLLLIFLLDLALEFPFGRGASLFLPVDVVGVIACTLTAYLSWHTMRELR